MQRAELRLQRSTKRLLLVPILGGALLLPANAGWFYNHVVSPATHAGGKSPAGAHLIAPKGRKLR